MFGALGVEFTAFVCRLWIKSLRVRVHAPEGYGPGILGVWHRDLLACGAAFRGMGVHALVSESHDGEFLARTLTRLGYTVTRGSDTRGSLNVRHLLKTLRSGGFVGMALNPVPHGSRRLRAGLSGRSTPATGRILRSIPGIIL